MVVPIRLRPVALAAVAVLMLPAFAAAAAPQTAASQTARSAPANRAIAARFTQSKLDAMLFDTSVRPRWIEGSDRFWYEYETSSGTTFWLVDPSARTRQAIFDNDDIAAQLTLLTRDPYDARHLPIERLKFVDDGAAVRFDVTSSQDEIPEPTEGDEQQEQEDRARKREAKKKVFHFEYDLQTRQLRELDDYEAPAEHPDWANISPDKEWVVFSRDHDLYLMSYAEYEEWLAKEKARKDAGEDEDEDGDEGDDDEDDADDEDESDVDPDIEEIRLTTDGEEHYTYGRGTRGWTDKEKVENQGKRQPAFVAWAADSSKFALVRRDQREVGDLWVINAIAEPRPTLETYRYDMPGEDNVTQSEIWVFDVAAPSGQKLATEAFQDQALNLFYARRFPRPDAEDPQPLEWLGDTSDRLYWGRISRDLKRYDVCVTDLASGETTVLIEERLNTYVETQRLELLASGDLLWWSERDGWGHVYRYGSDGTLKNRLTAGPWSVRGVEGIDEAAGVVYFESTGREDEDPYFYHLYRVGLDGRGLALLNPGNFDHRAAMSESNGYFVDNYSRVDTAPKAVVRDADGELVMDLEEADLSLLMASGYEFPEAFQVKAGDGVTDLYGVMYRPFDFDPAKSYPIIAYVYPGPQTESVTKSFSTRAQNIHLAQFGFVVIEIGNRGGHPARSKWYHNYGYGNLRDYGLEDKKVAIEQLAMRHDFIDADRVGIFGHSGGGFMSTAAMLVYPDFFKVAVSSSGNHENQIYNRWWSEKHHGVKEVVGDDGAVTFEYDIEKNSELAGNLKGHLLLTTGDIDNNVHPSLTYRMAHALIKANKRFDFFVFPGERHGYREFADYWAWYRAEYFARHLLGDAPDDADLMELNREVAKTGGR